MTGTTTLTRLQDGETLHIPLDAHTTLQVALGTVVVRQPLRWLGETVVAPLVVAAARIQPCPRVDGHLR